VLAESDACVIVEGNSYFPAEAVAREYCGPVRRQRCALGKASRTITTWRCRQTESRRRLVLSRSKRRRERNQRPRRVLERREGGGVGFPGRCVQGNFGTNRAVQVWTFAIRFVTYSHMAAPNSRSSFCAIGPGAAAYLWPATSLTPSKLRLVEVMKLHRRNRGLPESGFVRSSARRIEEQFRAGRLRVTPFQATG